ncbi:hypothetical protein PT974_11513 [Cladobotryum mycophilum]|uniref:BTB domain-containing protein n=1 Tax=Cladobotryum mycophilum TaxID=491253 RepID=A0ABR0S5F0_9HYPO
MVDGAELAKRSPPLASKEPPLVFDPEGDIILAVGTRPGKEMKVDSNTLCRASPVFQIMLRGNFVEARPGSGEWRVRLPEDDVNACIIVLDMIHCQHQLTPDNPSPVEFSNILLFTNKYDMTRIVRPVAKDWLSSIFTEGWPEYPCRALQACLFIAWELGLPTHFGKVANALASRCALDKDGLLVGLDGYRIFAEGDHPLNAHSMVGE